MVAGGGGRGRHRWFAHDPGGRDRRGTRPELTDLLRSPAGDEPTPYQDRTALGQGQCRVGTQFVQTQDGTLRGKFHGDVVNGIVFDRCVNVKIATFFLQLMLFELMNLGMNVVVFMTLGIPTLS